MINISITGQSAEKLNFPKLVSKSVNFVEIDISFSAEWEELNKTYQFTNGSVSIDVVSQETTIKIPHEVLASEGTLAVKVRGSKLDEVGEIVEVLGTANAVTYPVEDSQITDADNSVEVTPTDKEQITQTANDAKNIAQGVRDDADNGIFNGTNGTNGIDGTNGVNGTNGIDGQDGADGTNGVNGKDGTNGTDGVDGTNGINGTNGQDGTNGTNGIDGTNGVNGADGTNGLTISRSNFVIAPSNAVNANRADLVLTGTNDALAIQTALNDLATARADVTTQVRIDFLGGDINLDAAILIPNNFNLFGNGVRIIAVTFDSSDGNATPFPIFGQFDTNNYNANVEGFVFPAGSTCEGYINIANGNISNCTAFVSSNWGWGNPDYQTNNGSIDHCISGDIIGNKGMCVLVSGSISNCTVGAVSDGGYGILGTSISNCTVGAVSGGCGISGTSISNCTVGAVSGGYGISGTSISNCTVGAVSGGSYGISGSGIIGIITGNYVESIENGMYNISDISIMHNNFFDGEWHV
jgi:hypothetical protein